MRPHETAILFAIVAGTAFSSPAASAGDAGDAARPGLVFCCTAENDLYRVITAGGREYPRSDSAAEAVRAAAEGAGVLILADGYPGKATPIAPEVLEEASRKKLRLYIEYPSALPGLELGQPRQCPWERVVVASDAFGPELPRMRILMIHDCRMLPVEAARPHLVSAWVAGFDTAVYGLPGETWPLLFEHPQGHLLVATTKLSHFVTGRYSPSDACASVWRMIFGWLTPGALPELAWTPTVRPTYGRDEPLLKDAELSAARRGAEWFIKSRFLVHPAWKDKYARSQPDDFTDSDLVGPGPGPDWPIGDGSQGILEGHSSTIFLDGSQPIRWGLRGDCNTETAMALGLRSLIDGDPKYAGIARNLADFVYFNSPLNGGPRADPKSPSYGLLSFYSSGGGLGTYFPNDNAKANLATMTTAAVLKTDRWDEPLLRTILANFRVTGALGFRTGGPYSETMLQEGLAVLRRATIHYPWPQREGWAWAVYLWLYDKTRYEPLLERALADLDHHGAEPRRLALGNQPETDGARAHAAAAGLAAAGARYARAPPLVPPDRRRPAGVSGRLGRIAGGAGRRAQIERGVRPCRDDRDVPDGRPGGRPDLRHASRPAGPARGRGGNGRRGVGPCGRPDGRVPRPRTGSI